MTFFAWPLRVKRVVQNSAAAKSIAALYHRLNFIQYHYIYFVFVTLLTSFIVYGTSTDFDLAYVDAIFLTISAMTEAGLNTVNLSQLNTFQQVVLFILLQMGSYIFVSIFTLFMRRRAFEKRCKQVVRIVKERRARRRSFSGSQQHLRHSVTLPISPKPDGVDRILTPGTSSIPDLEETKSAPTSLPNQASRRRIQFADSKPAQHLTPNDHANEKSDTEEDLLQSEYPHYLSRSTTGRNAHFFGLSKEERIHLGGVEYRAVSFLFWLVLGYFYLLQLFGCITLGAYISVYYSSVCRENGLNPWWVGSYMAVSAFNNSGMSLLDANLIPFQNSYLVQIVMGFLILGGNTAFPIFLRGIIRTILFSLDQLYPSPETQPELKSTLRFILKYPRRVYTNLFPSGPTQWLLGMLILLNGLDWAGFEGFNRNNEAVTSIPGGYRVSSGLFQALAVRSGGFYIVPLSALRIANLVLYIIMMYISAFPVTITMRHSNVYEERSLGIFAEEPSLDGDTAVADDEKARFNIRKNLQRAMSVLGATIPKGTNRVETQTDSFTVSTNFIYQQVSMQVYSDLPGLVIAIFLITAIESANFMRDPVTYSVFNIAFEIVSGYGCVGISTGLPNAAYSFCGGWHVASKLILCAVMIKGRHRGLPVAIDRAVRLPGAVGMEGEWAEEDEDEGRRRGAMADRRSVISMP